MYKLTINDWGKVTVQEFEKIKDLIEAVIHSGPGAIIDINEGMIHWDRAEDETTNEFWDFVGKEQSKDYFRKQGAKGARITNAKRFRGKSKKEISEMMKKVRNGKTG